MILLVEKGTGGAVQAYHGFGRGAGSQDRV
jgi:hypothetical protein